MKSLALIFVLITLAACGKSSQDGQVATPYYGYKDGGTTANISKITFIGGTTSVGRYQITQAIVQKSDDSILKTNTICGDFEILGTLALAEVDGQTRNYDTYYGFYESSYIPDGTSKIAHTKNNAQSTYIETILSGAESCL